MQSPPPRIRTTPASAPLPSAPARLRCGSVRLCVAPAVRGLASALSSRFFSGASAWVLALSSERLPASALEARVEECDELRHALERERDDGAAKLTAHAGELSGLRLAFESERGERQAQLEARDDELGLLRAASEHEHDALQGKVASLEAKRAELRSAFDRINYLRNQAIEPQDGAAAMAAGKPGPAVAASTLAQQPSGRNPVPGEADAIVSKTTLLQARAQFEYLAREFIPLGDIASQVMCELGAYTMDLALVAAQPARDLPIGDVARSILAPLGSNQS